MSAGNRLREMVERAGHSFDSFAKDSGFAGASSVQRYMDPDRAFLPFDKVERFARALVGRGEPPITREEVYALSGVNPVVARRAPMPQPRRGDVEFAGNVSAAAEYAPPDLPLLGHVRGGGDEYIFGNGAEVLSYTTRPPVLLSVKDAYAIYVHGESMVPRFRPGELLYVDPVRPVAPGDDVVIQLNDGSGYVKELVRRTSRAVVCRQYSPAREVEYPADKVRSIHLIVSATRVRV